MRKLRERGIEPCIFYSNSNIFPQSEYELRRDTAKRWAESIGASFKEADYSPEKWQESAGAAWDEPGATQEDRCRQCYRMRFAESAKFAKENGFDALGTTLSVSPYQFPDIIREELERACERSGIEAFFEDYSPLYPETINASKEAGLYRQDYCGCAPSKAEAEEGRESRRAERERKRAQRAKAAQEQQEAIAQRKSERAEYDRKKARQREILRGLRQQERNRESEEASEDSP